MILLQAHRGDSLNYPENTFPAYYGAIEAGYSFIELDTKFTKDNECVLIHDSTVNRTGARADGSDFEAPVNVADLTLAELKQLDFGCRFSEKFRGTEIPELSELLAFVGMTKMSIKFDNIIEDATAKQRDYFFEKIRGSGAEQYVGITAKSVGFAKEIAKKLGKCIIHYDGPTGEEIYEALAAATAGHRLFIWLPSEKKGWLPYPPATGADVELAKKYAEVGLWTAHDRESLDYIISLKPDAMELGGGITPAQVKALADF